MRYVDLEPLKPERFKRLTGVSPATFDEMLFVITASWRDFGRPSKLSRADQLLMALGYWREYRSLALRQTSFVQTILPLPIRSVNPRFPVPSAALKTRSWRRASFPCRAKRRWQNPIRFGSLSWWTPRKRRLSVLKKAAEVVQRQKEVS